MKLVLAIWINSEAIPGENREKSLGLFLITSINNQGKELIMKSGHSISKSESVRILFGILAIVFLFCAGPAAAAPEAGTVTIVLEAEPDNLDPGNSALSHTGKVILKNVVEPLTEFNPDTGEITPRLATSWKQIDDYTWQFSLRKGVKFHDGEDFNAEAVLFNIKRIYEPRLSIRIRDKYFAYLKMEGKALDSHTVEIKTDKLEALLPTLMGTLTICSPNTPMDKSTRNPVGTGPYRFVKWEPGKDIVLERFAGYWGEQPQVKKAIYVFRSESALRASMVLIGEADLASNIAVQDANNPDMDYSYFNSETLHLILGAWEPPLNDIRVRKALNYAVDRNAIRGSILSKDVVPATQLVVPGIFGYNPDLKVWPYDPQKAKQSLDDARKDGVPVDREILMVGRTGMYPNNAELMEAVMAMYKAVGLNVKLLMAETGIHITYRDKPRPAAKGPIIIENQHDNDKGDAVFTVFGMYSCGSKRNSICDAKLDELMKQGQVASGEKRRDLFRAVFKRIYEVLIPDVILFHQVGYTRVGKRINFKPSLASNSEMQLAQITFK